MYDVVNQALRAHNHILHGVTVQTDVLSVLKSLYEMCSGISNVFVQHVNSLETE